MILVFHPLITFQTWRYELRHLGKYYIIIAIKVNKKKSKLKCCKDKISKRILKRFLFVDFYLLIKKKENKALIFSFVRRFVLYFSTNVKSIHRLIEENCKKLDGVVTRVENRLRGGEERRRRKSKYPLPSPLRNKSLFCTNEWT